MGRANVLYKNKYSCFSSIIDSFITNPMEKDEYEKWRLLEYGRYNFIPVEECYNISIEEAIHSMCLNRKYDEVINELKETNMFDNYTEHLVKNYFLDEEV